MTHKKETFRATYTEDGIQWLHPQNPSRIGDAYVSKTYTMVKWDGCKTFSSYHKSFIRPMTQDEILKSLEVPVQPSTKINIFILSYDIDVLGIFFTREKAEQAIEFLLTHPWYESVDKSEYVITERQAEQLFTNMIEDSHVK